MTYLEFLLKKIPDGRQMVVWYNNIFKDKSNPYDYFINYVFKNLETHEYKIVPINLNEIAAIPLGLIFNNKQATDEKIGEIYNCVIDIPRYSKNAQVNTQNISLYKNEPYFSLEEQLVYTDGIAYNLLQRSREQTLLEYTDVEGRVMLLPSYVIAQYYYYRSSSMRKQVMAAYTKNEDALGGLYKEKHLNNGNASIILKPNAKGRDGAEIFRFAHDEYADMMFHKIFLDLRRSSDIIKEKLKKHTNDTTRRIATLSAFFPFFGPSYFTFRGVKLTDGRILALEIIAEDSPYPFEKLTIYRQSKSLLKKVIPLGTKVNTTSSKINKYLSDKTPSSNFVPQDISTAPKVDGRMDLEYKEINYEMLDSNDSDGSEGFNDFTETTSQIDLSTNQGESSGDKNTAQANIENDNTNTPDDDWNKRERPGLEAFLLMLYTAFEKSQKKNIAFDYTVDDQLMLPQGWIKSLLKDNKTPRAYSCAHIEYKEKYVCVFDIERDKRIEGLSLLIIRMNDNTPVDQKTINKILLNFVRESGSWLRNMKNRNFKHTNIYHPQTITEDSIDSWADKLLHGIEKII